MVCLKGKHMMLPKQNRNVNQASCTHVMDTFNMSFPTYLPNSHWKKTFHFLRHNCIIVHFVQLCGVRSFRCNVFNFLLFEILLSFFQNGIIQMSGFRMIANLYRFLMNWQHIPHIHITYFVFFPVRHKSLLPNECSSIQTLFTKI